jgi:hypothetical protein
MYLNIKNIYKIYIYIYIIYIMQDIFKSKNSLKCVFLQKRNIIAINQGTKCML